MSESDSSSLSKCEQESGIKMLTRTSQRPSLRRLYEFLLGKPVAETNLGEVLQISGEAGCGKSFLMLEAISRTLLPDTWQGIRLGGCGASVIYIDADLKFNILQLASKLEAMMRSVLKRAKAELLKKEESNSSAEDSVIMSRQDAASFLKQDSTQIKSSIRDFISGQVLSKLVYIKCYHSSQFVSAILTLDTLLASKPDVSLVCVDSMSAFYWYDRTYLTASWREHDSRCNKVAKVFLEMVKRCGVVVLCVQQKLLSDEYNSNYFGRDWNTAIDYHINITPRLSETLLPGDDDTASNVYQMTVTQGADVVRRSVRYGKEGLKFL